MKQVGIRPNHTSRSTSLSSVILPKDSEAHVDHFASSPRTAAQFSLKERSQQYCNQNRPCKRFSHSYCPSSTIKAVTKHQCEQERDELRHFPTTNTRRMSRERAAEAKEPFQSLLYSHPAAPAPHRGLGPGGSQHSPRPQARRTGTGADSEPGGPGGSHRDPRTHLALGGTPPAGSGPPRPRGLSRSPSLPPALAAARGESAAHGAAALPPHQGARQSPACSPRATPARPGGQGEADHSGPAPVPARRGQTASRGTCRRPRAALPRRQRAGEGVSRYLSGGACGAGQQRNRDPPSLGPPRRRHRPQAPSAAGSARLAAAPGDGSAPAGSGRSRREAGGGRG